ncbi:MAG TPA: DUF1572 domain-containing protein [Terriglobia bacterium]|nr:DUF1572 domain-containing protein [Terriglobia bacterium]
MALQFSTSYLADSASLFRYYKGLGERAMAQLLDDQLFYSVDEECNSVAIIVKHLAGNMRSRWTDFLITDGEKPNRNRDSEFEDPPKDRQQLMQLWDEGWACLLGALESLDDSQLGRQVLIRGEAHSVMQAINRQLCHYAYHVGQIVALAKQARKGDWVSLSVPRGKSADFNKRVRSGDASQR